MAPRIRSVPARKQFAATLTVEAGAEDDWAQLLLSHVGGPDIAVIERNAAASSDLVSAEVEEFLEEIADCKPAAAAAWLAEYLPNVLSGLSLAGAETTKLSGKTPPPDRWAAGGGHLGTPLLE